MGATGDRQWIALAGILATALVGIVGAVGTWAVSDANRSSQRSLDHDRRVFDRRADAYVKALDAVERQRRDLKSRVNGFPSPKGSRTLLNYEDGSIYAGVVAFGSSAVIRRYSSLRRGVVIFLNRELHQPDSSELRALVDGFERDQTSFQDAVRADLR